MILTFFLLDSSPGLVPVNNRDRFLIPRRVGERHLPTFNFIHSIGSESFCVVLLTTLFGELVLNPYFCNIYKIINNNKL